MTIFYDLSSFFNKVSASCKFRLKSSNSNFFFKKRKSMSRLKIFKNRYYEMKAHTRKIFPRWYHILKIIFIFDWFFDLDVLWYDDWYWKASPGSTLNDFNDGLTTFHDLSSCFNKIWASCKFSLKSWNSNFFFKKRKLMFRLKIFTNHC